MKPRDRAGYSILIYDVRYPPDAPIDRAVVIGPLASDVPPDRLGAQPGHFLRAKWCAWQECFILTPHSARYIVRDWGALPADLSALARAQAKPIDMLALGSENTFTVAEWDATPIIENKLASLRSAPVAAPSLSMLTLPISFENGLTLVGYQVNANQIAPGQSFEALTYWQVTERPKPPVAIFVHLLDATGNIRGQHDGLGAAMAMLEPGDLIIQRHIVTANGNATPGTYRLQVGLYQPITLERFQAQPQNSPSLDRILLSTLEVKTP